MIHDFVPLMVALVWPLTILILVCWFRKGIKDLIKSVTEAKIGNSVFFKFWQAKTDVSAEALLPEPKDITAPSAAKWENTANLFWLGIACKHGNLLRLGLLRNKTSDGLT